MGTALVAGAISVGIVKAENVIGAARTKVSRDAFARATGGRVTEDVSEVVRESEVVLLATKPQDIAKTLGEAGFKRRGGALLVSVAAGVTLETLEKLVPASVRVVRTMPNTPSLVGKGAAGFCLGMRCKDGDREIVRGLFEAVGLAIEVPEKLIDAVAGLSGSGPAYVYLMIEALADGGVKVGLPRADAIRLAAQTVSGAAQMVIETGEHPAMLRDKVASPGGTTIAGLAVLEERAVRSALIGAVSASYARAGELGKA